MYASMPDTITSGMCSGYRGCLLRLSAMTDCGRRRSEECGWRGSCLHQRSQPFCLSSALILNEHQYLLQIRRDPLIY
ncbi:hypothetical protein E2C01_003678 [Portunus trituberculatus]|uniref:Uncharacterized protein n=1 Tax=Portunus trituberculatus TaxID=210409 RepID=A0A5B7CRV6_PORTR|nr:hypothetical protein [Portunus trituberculatus]